MKNVIPGLPVCLVLAFSITFLSSSYGQQKRGPFNRLLHLSEELELSETQQSELEALQANYQAAFAALKEKDHNTEDKKAAFQDLMENMKEEVDAILTEGQQDKLQDLKAQHRKRRPSPEKKSALKEAITEYRNTTIIPVMQTQRLKLETSISDTDKAQIEEIRSQLAGLRPPHAGGHRNGHHQKKPSLNETQKAALESLKGLVEKYQEDIRAVLTEIAPQSEQWKLEMKAILAAHLDGLPQQGRRHPKHHLHQPFKKAGQFLLMEIPESTPSLKSNLSAAITNVSVFPNPAQNLSTVQFEVLEAGTVSMIMMNEQGQEEVVLLNTSLEAGNQQMELDLSGLKNGLHYVMIIQENGRVTTEKLIVAKP